MKYATIVLALFALAACTPAADRTPEGAVRAIYDEVQRHIGREVTPQSAIPMTDDLRALLTRAEAAAQARDEPFIDGDLAANCQDCTSLSDLSVGPQSGPEPIPAQDGHVLIEARFTINGDEERSVLYDLVETPQGWRVDNILTDGFNLRTEAQAYLAEETIPADQPPPSP